ncbi:phage major capsid protein, P2 family [Chromobacterium phragmitis]|uniref:phage major capsid protein, P2 family n=1 Tax=Chromobacterium phragmitis TaxID=2202141 RepID=UPI000DECB77E|nr:phage major capsid protein, P2 family [Chromobacterium phragmitis]AXE32224.1 phage major capsid protein, P2 family [Chromobacterium phragmitis]
MRNETRPLYEAFAAQVAKLNGVATAEKSFSVTPAIQQKLESRIQLSSAFLGMINIFPVTDLEAEKLGLGVLGPIAGRTKTSASKKRQPRSMADFVSGKYRCEKTDFDTAIPYAQIDMWAKFADFQTRLRDAIVKQQALDRIMIGFNGISVEEDTDRVANPLLQDVNKGWLQQYRENAAARVMKEVKKDSGKVLIGPGVATEDGYKNLDALVFDATNNLIHEVFAEHPDLVVVVGRDLLADKYFPILNKDNAPTEQLAADVVISQKRIGNLPAVRVPFFPAGKMLITPLSNLSIYYQEGGRRRHLREEPDYNQVANYESSNDAYVVECYEAGCLIENIELVA